MAKKDVTKNKTTAKTMISAKVEGVARSPVPLKAVVIAREMGEVSILAETPVDKETFTINVESAAEKLPEKMKIAVVPRDLTNKSAISRLADAGDAPAATVSRDLVKEREGKLTPADVTLKPLDPILPLWPLKHTVCGRVIKRDPVTGEECPVPGATVHVLDVDYHLLWWYPYPGHPWGWIFPFWIRGKEEIGTAVTDKCGNFCVKIPLFDIDAVIRYRLRFRCLWEIMRVPNIRDAIEAGIVPDPRVYPDIELLPRLKPWKHPRHGPEPVGARTPVTGEYVSTPVIPIPPPNPVEKAGNSSRQAYFNNAEMLLEKRAMFEPVRAGDVPVLERPAFPRSFRPPSFPDDASLEKILPDLKMIRLLRSAPAKIRLLRCWAEFVPSIHLFLDVPDIVFRVEQDIDGDGSPEIIYDEGYGDVNWNLSEPTTNIVIEAWNNAICIPCGPDLESCIKSGIVGISEMPADPAYISAQGYAVRVNRPSAAEPLPVPTARPDLAETPFCKTIRIVGCPGYGQAEFYRVFYDYKGSESRFRESWYEYQISTGTTHHIIPDAAGFYPVRPHDDFFPYHTLINWPTAKYPDGEYTVRLELYDGGKSSIGPPLDPVSVTIDNSAPYPVQFESLRWRAAGTPAWSDEVNLNCAIITRPQNTDIELTVTYQVVADHLRDVYIKFVGCDGNLRDEDAYWHHNVNNNTVNGTFSVTIPKTDKPGGYWFYLVGRSRAFNAVGGLATDWNYDTLHIWTGRVLTVAVVDE
jgi:hypothetical protein